MFNNFFFSKNMSFLDNVEKSGAAKEATDYSTAHVLCMLDN